MKKGILLLTVPLFLICSSFGEDFRGYAWGSTKYEVIGSDGLGFLEEADGSIFYEDELLGVKALAGFYFDHADRLEKAGYFLASDSKDLAVHRRDFDMFDELLKDKYGDPLESGEVRLNDSYKDTVSMRAVAFGRGDLQLVSKYETEKTNIVHSTTAEDYKVRHLVMYVWRRSSEEMRESELEAAKAKL